MNPFAATHRKDLPNHTATPYFLRSPFINFPIATPSRAQPACYSVVMSTYRKSNPNGADRAADRATTRMGSFFQITCSSSSRGHAMRQSSLPGLRSSPGLGSFFRIAHSAHCPRSRCVEPPLPRATPPPAEVGFVFSKHSFGLIAQAHNASIILTRPALPTEDGFVLQNAHGLGPTRNPLGKVLTAACPCISGRAKSN
jgi:hypothetical protein